MASPLSDVSNKAPAKQARLKTFVRRRRDPQHNDQLQTPASQADNQVDSCTTPLSSTCSPSSTGSTPVVLTKPSRPSALHHGRRSFILHAAALKEAPASRSLLLQWMPKAKQAAYFAHLKHWANYFAEVDQFELIEESPDAVTSKKGRCRISNLLPGRKSTACFTHSPLYNSKCMHNSTGGCPLPFGSVSGSGLLSETPAASSVQRKDPAAADSPQVSHPLADCAAPSNEIAGRQALASSTPGISLQHGSSADESCAGVAATVLQAATPETAVPALPPAQAEPVAAGDQEGRVAASQQAMCLQEPLLPSQGVVANAGSVHRDPCSPVRCSLASATPLSIVAGSARERTSQNAVIPVHGRQELQCQSPAATAAPAADVKVEVLSQQLQQWLLLQSDATGSSASQQPPVPLQQVQLDQQLPHHKQQLDDVQLQQLMQDAFVPAAEQLAELQLAVQLTPLQQLLHACGQSVDVQQIPSMAELMAELVNARSVIKLGEGTYGEAFKSGQVVFKLVPMEGPTLINGWPQKGAGNLLAEAVIAMTLSALGDEIDAAGTLHPSHTKAFVQTHRVGVCHGPYPQPFIKAWQAWDKRNKSENDPIGWLPADQLYAVFAMADCGKDLEGHQLRGFDQARSIILQVVLALAVAEESLAFEHRDLHWGNVMLAAAPSTYTACRLRGSTIRVCTEGVMVRLIDFTASRLQTPGSDVAFCDLELEDGLFDGPKGKPQFEAYRRMRKLTGGDWSGSYPGTNVLWVLYLAELLLSTDKPVPAATAAQKRRLREFKSRVTGYRCCAEVVCDELFAGLWTVVQETSQA